MQCYKVGLYKLESGRYDKKIVIVKGRDLYEIVLWLTLFPNKTNKGII